MEKIDIDDLNVSFFDVDAALKKPEEADSPAFDSEQQYQFGPSKQQMRSIENWEGCDGKFFFPINKRAKLGRISDFLTAAIQRAKEQERESERQKEQQERDAARMSKKKKEKPAEKSYGMTEAQEEDDDDFTVTTEGRYGQQKKQGQKDRNQNQNDKRTQGKDGKGNNISQWNKKNLQKQGGGFNQEAQGKREYVKGQSKKEKARQNFWAGNNSRTLRSNLRDFSVDVTREWKFLKEYTRQNFDRLPTLRPVPLDNAKECGDVPQYETKWDRANGKKPQTLPQLKQGHATFNASLFDDPTMIEMIEQEAADIFTTEQVAAVLMCATKSNYSWDLEIKVYDGKIFIDKRSEEDDQQSKTNILNYQTVCETSLEHQPETNNTINGIRPLMKEAQKINNAWLHHAGTQNYAQVAKFDDDNPFIEEENQVATRHGYVYKVWKIQDAEPEKNQKELKICIRCAVHTHTGKFKPDGERQFQNVYAFNEHDLQRTNWRSTIENGLISCLTREITDNSFKVSRWLVQSLLAEVDLIKFAFVSRKDMQDNGRHLVMATHSVQTASWANQLNISMDRYWPIIKYLVTEITAASEEAQRAKKEKAAKEEKKNDESEEDDGDEHEFILLKDFNSMCIRLYRKDEDLAEEEDELALGEKEQIPA